MDWLKRGSKLSVLEKAYGLQEIMGSYCTRKLRYVHRFMNVPVGINETEMNKNIPTFLNAYTKQIPK